MGTYNGKEPYVFVSYCHTDSEQVLPIIQGLQDRGFRVWYDEGIEVSVAWAKYVAERLEQSSCVLAYVTHNFDDSHNCWQELDFAMEEKKQIVAIKADGGRKLSAGMRMRLVSIQTMPFEKYGSVEKILDTLSQAAVMKPCLGAVAEPPKPAEPTAEELYEQGRAFYDQEAYEKAVPLLRKAAELGNAPAQNVLGFCYQHSRGVVQNYEEAVKWFRKSAEQGYASAQNNLGYCFQEGLSVLQNTEEAMKWYLKAAEQGEATAQYNLGCCYKYSEGALQNVKEAVKWFRKSAEQGHASAQNNLGYCYQYGEGVTKNQKEAVKWYLKGAEQGDLSAQNNLGYCYQHGEGITKNQKEAQKWYLQSAEQGHAPAQYNLGWCYQYGEGVRKNKTEARKWYQKAANQGYEHAIEALEEL